VKSNKLCQVVHEREIGIDMGRLATLRCGSALAHNMFIESSAADIGQSNAKVVRNRKCANFSG